MPNPFFKFKQFVVYHDRCAMKVTTDACLFGAWCAQEIKNENAEEFSTALDIGAGTGLMSLMMAQKNNLVIDAVEIEENAAMQAEENIQRSLWQNRVAVHKQDVLKFAPGKKYDVIISNPPFYENEIKSDDLNRNKAHHGHALRLEELLILIKEHLLSTGKFFLLLPYKRVTEAKSLLNKHKLYITNEVIIKQSVLHAPFRLMIKGSFKPMSTVASYLSIKNEKDQYTEEFVQLLKDYYLYL